RAQGGKDLKPAEKEVSKLMTNHLVGHWVRQLRDKKRFDEQVKWSFAAKIEPKTGILSIGSLNLDINNAPIEDVAKVTTQLSQSAKDLLPFVETRTLLESPEGPQARLEHTQTPYDLDMLRQKGMGDLADRLAAEMRDAEEAIEEDAAEDEPTNIDAD